MDWEPVRSNRIGAWFIPQDLAFRHPHAALTLQYQCLIISCMFDAKRKGYGYIGYSELFDPIPIGDDDIPGYNVTIQAQGSIITGLTFNRAE